MDWEDRMVLCLSRVWKWKFSSWKAELDWGISGPSGDAWEGFSVVLSAFLCPPHQLQPFPSLISWRESNVHGEVSPPPATVGEVNRKGKLFCGKSAAAHGDSPHGWAYNWSMKDTVFLEVPWSGVKEKPWSAQIASPRPAALQWVVFSVLGRTVPCRPDTGQEELKVGHSPHQKVYQIIPPVFLAAQCVILC